MVLTLSIHVNNNLLFHLDCYKPFLEGAGPIPSCIRAKLPSPCRALWGRLQVQCLAQEYFGSVLPPSPAT